jgi:hypothetical protein
LGWHTTGRWTRLAPTPVATDQGISDKWSFCFSFVLSWPKTAAPMRIQHRSTCQGLVGSLFKIRLSAYGYTLVAKGVEAANLTFLQHEKEVYDQLCTIQEKHVRVPRSDTSGPPTLLRRRYFQALPASQLGWAAPCPSALSRSTRRSPLTRLPRPLPDCIGCASSTATRKHAISCTIEAQ